MKYNFVKNKSHLCNGDLQSVLSKKSIEVKASLGGMNHDKFNFVQIRLNHDCDYLLTAYYLTEDNLDERGELFIFKLDKQAIKKLILKHGQYSHGTILKLGKITKNSMSSVKNDKEYSLRPKYNDICWKKLLKYRIEEEEIMFC